MNFSLSSYKPRYKLTAMRQSSQYLLTMKLLREYFQNSTIHGLHYIANSQFHWSERVFWTLCVLASWGISLFIMLNIIQQYRDQTVSFTADTSYVNWNTSFPSIIICEHDNPDAEELINKWFPKKGMRKRHEMTRFMSFYKGIFYDKENCSPQRRKHADDNSKCLFGNYSYYTNQIRSSCSKLLTYCEYNGESFTCCDEFLPVNTFHGLCFALNSLSSKKYRNRGDLPFIIRRSSNQGFGKLSFELSDDYFVFALSQDSVTSETNSDTALCNSYYKEAYGIRKMITFNVYLSVKETETTNDAKLINFDRRNCRFQDESDLSRSEYYSRSSCENECLITAQLEICNCSIHTLPKITESEECDLDGILCIQASMDLIKNFKKSCQCLVSCFETEVNIIGCTEHKTDNTNKKFQDQDLSLVRYNVIVNPPTIRYIRSVVKTPLTLLVSIGGTVGIFLGASLLTIVEVFYYFFVRPLGNAYLEKGKRDLKTSRKTNRICDKNVFLPFIN